jgi:low temperature requirement protein LtrA
MAWMAMTQPDEDRRVTTLELFFDLVFAFGITLVTAYLADNHDARGFLEGLLLLALLWWAWTGFTWLATSVGISSGRVRLVMFPVMAGLLVVAIGMPEWFHDAPEGFAGLLDAPVVVALAYMAVRVGHLLLFAIQGRGTPGLPLSWPLVLVAVLGMAVAAQLWVIYFDPFAERLENEVRGRSGTAQVELARTSTPLSACCWSWASC